MSHWVIMVKTAPDAWEPMRRTGGPEYKYPDEETALREAHKWYSGRVIGRQPSSDVEIYVKELT